VRRRIVQSTLAVAVVAVALLGVPLAVAAVLGQGAMAQRTVENVAGRIGTAVEGRLERGEEVTDAVLERVPEGGYGVVRIDGAVVASTGSPQPRAIQGQFQSATTSVYVEVSGRDVLAAQVRTVLLVLVAAVVAVAAAVGLGLLQARRLAEPLVDLAARARRLGAGETRPAFPRYGLEEVDEVAAALDSSAGRVAAMLAGERQFASDASHQLRTPLTALSMRLEEILNTDDPETVREEARVALGQVERLSGVVDALLASARHSRAGPAVAVDVDEVLEQQLEEWAPAFAAARRSTGLAGARGLRAVASPGGLGQVVATLLENSLRHGAGSVTVRTRTTGASVVVEVSDEGPGIPPELGARVFQRAVSGTSGTGLGLALARDLAEGDGGRLELVQSRPAVFALFLPAAAPTPERAGPGPAQRVGTGSASTTAGNTQRR
jgi:signal transduction histidine kinase